MLPNRTSSAESVPPIPLIATVHTPAKLNLYLEILGKRPDGYHDLETIMVPVALYDRVRVCCDSLRRLSDIVPQSVRVSCDWFPSETAWQCDLQAAVDTHPGLISQQDPSVASLLQLPQNQDNLVHRGLIRLLEEVQKRGGMTPSEIEVDIQKSIPSGAGMGGASSNAAAALMAMGKILGSPCDDALLHQVAAEIGSDVNFFLGAEGRPLRAALATGRGERLTPLTAGRSVWVVVVYPPHALSTGKVFSHAVLPKIPLTPSATIAVLSRLGHRKNLPQFALFNRLQATAVELSPWISEIMEKMWQVGLQGCQLTGSGSACFAFPASLRKGIGAVRRLREMRLGRVVLTRLTRTPVVSFHPRDS